MVKYNITMTNKIFIHNLKFFELNRNPEEFIDKLLGEGYFYNWMKEDLTDFEIERFMISDIKQVVSHEHVYITSTSNPRLKKMTLKIIKSCFDWKKIIKKIKMMYYEKTE